MDNLKTIGSFLKDSRINQSLDLSDVAEKTKINLKLLRSLEEDQLSQLPNKTYVIGFVKSYAKHLGLNEEEALLSLNYTYEQKVTPDAVEGAVFNNVEESPTELEDSARAIFKTFYNKKALILIVVSIITIVIIKSIISFFSNIAKEKVSFEKKEILSPVSKEAKEEISKEDNSQENKENEIANVDQQKISEPNPQESLVAPKNTAIENKVEEKKIEEKEIEKKVEPKSLNGKLPYKEFYNVPSKLYTILEDAPENNNIEILPTRYKNAMIEGLQNVYIHATEEDTWISFKVDDQKIKRYVLKKGRSVLLKGDRVLLFMGNINATKIFLNNKLIFAESKTGVKSLIFPQEESSEYKLPLFPTYKYKSYTASDYMENMVEKEN